MYTVENLASDEVIEAIDDAINSLYDYANMLKDKKKKIVKALRKSDSQTGEKDHH